MLFYSLTEELLKSTTAESEFVVKNLIFERLAPLLVLKVVPYTYFASLWNTETQGTDIDALCDILVLR